MSSRRWWRPWGWRRGRVKAARVPACCGRVREAVRRVAHRTAARQHAVSPGACGAHRSVTSRGHHGVWQSLASVLTWAWRTRRCRRELYK